MRLSRLVLLSTALTTACQTGASDRFAGADSDRPPSSSGEAVRLDIFLTELTERPTPAGLPLHLELDAPGLPPVGGGAAIRWRAIDGDPSHAPRAGTGRLDVAATGRTTIILQAEDRSGGGATMKLAGTITGRRVVGTFSDRLFFARAGRFSGEVRSP